MVYVFLFLQQVIASTTHLVAQDASLNIPPDTVLLFRCLGSAAILLIILYFKEKRLNIFARIERKDYGQMLLIGMLNIPMNQLLYLHGVKYTTPANTALLYAMTPAIVFLLTLRFRKAGPGLWKIFGIFVAFVGASLIMFERGATISSEHTYGNLLIFIAVIAWSLYTMLGRPLVVKYGAVYTTAANMILGSLIYLPYGLWSANMAEIRTITTPLWVELVYLAAIASVANYLLYFLALAKLETNRVAIFQNLQPVLTTVMALALGKVILTFALWGGGILALVGVLIVQLA